MLAWLPDITVDHLVLHLHFVLGLDVTLSQAADPVIEPVLNRSSLDKMEFPFLTLATSYSVALIYLINKPHNVWHT